MKYYKTQSRGGPRIVFSSLLLVCLMLSARYSMAEKNIDLESEKQLLNASFSNLVELHRRLDQEIDTLRIKGREFCADKSSKRFIQVRGQWSEAMRAWSELAPINFGPIDEMNTVWRFQFWPDRINLVHRKFKSRVRGKNKKLSAKELAEASVAIQGLSALEYLLFDPSISFERYKSEAHLCELLVNTSENLRYESRRLSHAWANDFAERWLAEQSINRNVEKYFSGMVMALGTITKFKLGKPLGLNTKSDDKNSEANASAPKAIQTNPWQLESWRSRTSLDHIYSTLQSSYALYSSQKGFSWFLKQKNKGSELDKSIKHLFNKAIELEDRFSVSAFELIESGKTEDLFALHSMLTELHSLLKLEYSKVAGIQFRFNAHDGD